MGVGGKDCIPKMQGTECLESLLFKTNFWRLLFQMCLWMNIYVEMTWVRPRNACTSLEPAPVDIVVYFRCHSQQKMDILVCLGVFQLELVFSGEFSSQGRKWSPSSWKQMPVLKLDCLISALASVLHSMCGFMPLAHFLSALISFSVIEKYNRIAVLFLSWFVRGLGSILW